MTNAFTDTDDFITLIGPDMASIHAAYQAQGLAERNYVIMHRTGRHRFTKTDGDASDPMFEGRAMIAATFGRRPG